MKGKQNRNEARETFRQFAWNLAGTLAASNSKSKAGSRPAEKRS
jgi:hypothetical protein